MTILDDAENDTDYQNWRNVIMRFPRNTYIWNNLQIELLCYRAFKDGKNWNKK